MCQKCTNLVLDGDNDNYVDSFSFESRISALVKLQYYSKTHPIIDPKPKALSCSTVEARFIPLYLRYRGGQHLIPGKYTVHLAAWERGSPPSCPSGSWSCTHALSAIIIIKRSNPPSITAFLAPEMGQIFCSA